MKDLFIIKFLTVFIIMNTGGDVQAQKGRNINTDSLVIISNGPGYVTIQRHESIGAILTFKPEYGKWKPITIAGQQCFAKKTQIKQLFHELRGENYGARGNGSWDTECQCWKKTFFVNQRP